MLKVLQEEMNKNPSRIYENTHKKMETTYMYLRRKMDKENIHIYTISSIPHMLKTWNRAIFKLMDGTIKK